MMEQDILNKSPIIKYLSHWIKHEKHFLSELLTWQ